MKKLYLMFIYKTNFAEITLNETVFLSSNKANGKEVLLNTEKSAIVSLLAENIIYRPIKAEIQEVIITVYFKGNRKVFLKYFESDICVTFEVIEVPEDADALMFGPVFVTLDEMVGDIIGVCQGEEVLSVSRHLTSKP